MLANKNIKAILDANHNEAFSFLGLHQEDDSGFLTIRTFQPGATTVSVISKTTGKVINHLKPVAKTGIFEVTSRRKKRFQYLLKISINGKEKIVEDIYSFPQILSDIDIQQLASGQHKKPYQVLGAHPLTHSGVNGYSFAVWAPAAANVALVGDFNNWDGRIYPMRLRHDCGVWEIFIPDMGCAENYKFEIKDREGNLLPLKSDPYAQQSEYRPDTSSVTVKINEYNWHDDDWMSHRGDNNSRNSPISIYEVHLGSWKRKETNEYLDYRELSAQLIPYVKSMNFTHIELMPVSEYPFDGSWGYQPVGLFAPTSRFATGTDSVVEDFKYFIDQCHRANIGVLVDWVPGHFPEDEHGLSQFDGSFLYEHEDRQRGFHPDWNTLIYNFGRTEVANFLRASAMHWLDIFHIDGIRVDAVASMLYLDYSRKDGEWTPNEHGGNENLEAIAFLKQFNEELYLNYPGTFSVAEESTAWPGVSKPTDSGGLGFGFKWNMGWMNDSLQYMNREPIYRKHHQDDLSFSLVYAFDENFVLPLSHDEVVHGKGSILGKMPGDEWQKFANLRAYYGFMWAHPGKKLLFMGCEFAQSKEWNFDQSLDWHQLDEPQHKGVQDMVTALNKTYTSTPALYEKDCGSDGFEWIDHSNAEQSIYAFIRYGNDRKKPIIIICNFTPTLHQNYYIGVPVAGTYVEVFNSDLSVYGGSGHNNLEDMISQQRLNHGRENSISITVPPLSTIMLELKR